MQARYWPPDSAMGSPGEGHWNENPSFLTAARHPTKLHCAASLSSAMMSKAFCTAKQRPCQNDAHENGICETRLSFLWSAQQNPEQEEVVTCQVCGAID